MSKMNCRYRNTIQGFGKAIADDGKMSRLMVRLFGAHLYSVYTLEEMEKTITPECTGGPDRDKQILKLLNNGFVERLASE